MYVLSLLNLKESHWRPVIQSYFPYDEYSLVWPVCGYVDTQRETKFVRICYIHIELTSEGVGMRCIESSVTSKDNF